MFKILLLFSCIFCSVLRVLCASYKFAHLDTLIIFLILHNLFKMKAVLLENARILPNATIYIGLPSVGNVGQVYLGIPSQLIRYIDTSQCYSFIYKLSVDSLLCTLNSNNNLAYIGCLESENVLPMVGCKT